MEEASGFELKVSELKYLTVRMRIYIYYHTYLKVRDLGDILIVSAYPRIREACILLQNGIEF